jgi:hypothetical protein
MMSEKMSQGKIQATILTVTGFCLMVAVIWTVVFFI